MNYQRVVEYLSKKLSGQTREDIATGCKLEGGELTVVLNNLNE